MTQHWSQAPQFTSEQRSAGCVFNNLRGDEYAADSMLVLHAPVMLNSTVLRALSKPRGDQGDWRRLGWQNTTGALYVQGLNATVIMASSTIASALQPWPILLRSGAALFSDNSTDVVRPLPPSTYVHRPSTTSCICSP